MARSAQKRIPQETVRSKPFSYPDYIAPCLASTIGRPPDGDKWVHEIKFDGFRSQLHKRGGNVTIYSRDGHDWTDRYRAIAEHAAQIGVRHCVLDGEMAVLRQDGTCDYWEFQKDVHAAASARMSYFAFDLLFLDGQDLRRRPLLERKAMLRDLLAQGPAEPIRYSEHFEIDGATMLALAHRMNVEGIVSKRVDSPYRSVRGDHWIKTPCQYRETLLVAGMAFDDDEFGGLYVARRRKQGLVYAGKVEDGFTDDAAAALRAQLEPLVTRKQPVATTSRKTDAKWVEPVLQIRIAHRGGLKTDRVRRPVFEGFANDSSPVPVKASVRLPSAVPRENIMRELQDAVVPGKEELKSYWRKVGRKALGHVGRRPLTLVRHVAGVTFYHKGPLPPVPAAVHQLEMRKADGSRGIRLWVDSVEGLLGLVDMDVVEVHPWAALVADIERPDVLIFDLDAGLGITWPFVAETALKLRGMLADEGFECWPKVTGGTGLHVMVPIEPELTHKAAYNYAKQIAWRLADTDRLRYTILPGEDHRIGKLFIDFFRNGRGSSAVAAYSPRARPGLPIARPVTWAEVESRERPGLVPVYGKLREDKK